MKFFKQERGTQEDWQEFNPHKLIPDFVMYAVKVVTDEGHQALIISEDELLFAAERSRTKIPDYAKATDEGEGRANRGIRMGEINLVSASTDKGKSVFEELFKPEVHVEKKDAINPAHYKDYLLVTLGGEFVAKLQWMETQQFKPFFRLFPEAFVHAVLMQSDKYLSRMGQKDDETQEIQKALWYLKFAAAFKKNGNQPIRIDDIDTILNGPTPVVDVRKTRFGVVFKDTDETMVLVRANGGSGLESYIVNDRLRADELIQVQVNHGFNRDDYQVIRLDQA